MKKWMLILPFSLFALFSFNAQACSCFSTAKNFFDTVSMELAGRTANEPVIPNGITVVLGKVEKYLQLREGPGPTEMVVDVEYILQGNVPAKKVIVEGDNGIQCRPYVSNFPIGSTQVFAISKADDGPHYAISICGYYSLKVNKPQDG